MKRETDSADANRIGFLGPPGTFSEEALERWADAYEPVPLPSIQDVLLAVEKGEPGQGIVPIENSIEGSVNLTIDMLIFDVDLQIMGEIILPVDHNLLVRPGVGLEQIEALFSQPHATAQCRRYLKQNLHGVPIYASNSTADAARIVSEERRPVGAIATRLAASNYGLEVLAANIQDVAHNATRFLIVGRGETEPTGSDKTSLVCFIYVDRPGSLLEILQEFASRSINLTKIESRPTKQRLGEYCFFIEMEGHQRDEPVSGALATLREKLPLVRVLGSYPQWKEAG